MNTRLRDFTELFPLRCVRAPDAPDARLDAALGEVLPGSGLRARRRLWSTCRISVNGQARAPGYLTRAGDVLEAAPRDAFAFRAGLSGVSSRIRRPAPADAAPEQGTLRVVARTADYIVFDKASGLHCAHIAGSPHVSLESLARNLFSEEDADGLHFLTRLDFATSGLVVAALNARAAARFRRAERDGLTRKSYLAAAQGRLTAPLLLMRRLRTDRRSVTAVLSEDTPDATRHCRVLPLPRRPAAQGLEEVSLVRVDIMRGARHQVRAALAAAGFPLCGDALYGGSACPFRAQREIPGFYLHHSRLESPELGAQSLPAWAGLFAAPDEVQALLRMPMPDAAPACDASPFGEIPA
ncbi:MAG: RluA family pseudouridine synthase [Desulfovibrio sp.]|jgi:23S rRNA pseudouridine1911/1915/1917 synthase|nr:RluA family pseudouridine synthase [Desulfovibrio sp.]